MSNDSVEKGLQTTRKEFSAVEVTAQGGDLAAAAQAALAKAQVEARYIMALQHPRNMVKVRQDILAICAIPEFANDKSTLYHVPRGQGSIEGLGIRFAEAAAESWTNILMEAPTVYEDDNRRHIRMTTTDLEKNVTYMKDIVVKKTVERLFVPDGETYISVRVNSEGKPTYTIPATDDSLAMKEGAMISKAMRTQVLRLIPVDLKNECEKKIKEIRTNKVKEDPAAALKAVVDGMLKQNVTVPMLEEFLEHPIDQVTPAEIVNLQAVYGTLRDGIETWKSIMEKAEEMRKIQPKTKPGAGAGTTTEPAGKGVAGAEAKVAAGTTGASAPPAGEKPPAAPTTATAAKAATGAAKKAAGTGGTKAATPPAAAPKAQTAPAPTPAAQAAPPAQAPAAEQAPTPAPAAPEAPATATAETTHPADAPPDWAEQAPAESTVAEAPAPAPVETAPEAAPFVQSPSAATGERLKSKNAEIRKVKLPDFIDWTSAADQPTEADIEAARAETNRLGVSLEKTVTDWTGAELAQLNRDTVLILTNILQNYKPAGK